MPCWVTFRMDTVCSWYRPFWRMLPESRLLLAVVFRESARQSQVQQGRTSRAAAVHMLKLLCQAHLPCQGADARAG